VSIVQSKLSPSGSSIVTLISVRFMGISVASLNGSGFRIMLL